MYGSTRSSDWSDNYIAHDLTPFTQPTLPNAHNVDVTSLDPNVINILGTQISSHVWPLDFYRGTIPPSTVSGAGGYGYPRSLEGGGWEYTSWFPKGNDPVSLLGGSGIKVADTTERYDSPLDFSKTSNFTSSTGTVDVSADSFSMATGSPVSFSSLVAVSLPVNMLLFNADFVDNGAEGLLSVFWDNEYLGQIDQRYVLDGSQEYSLLFSEDYDPGTYSLTFCLAPYTDIQSTVVISNVVTGYFGAVPEASTVVLLVGGAISLFGYSLRRRRRTA
jgi:hypothetical protein